MRGNETRGSETNLILKIEEKRQFLEAVELQRI